MNLRSCFLIPALTAAGALLRAQDSAPDPLGGLHLSIPATPRSIEKSYYLDSIRGKWDRSLKYDPEGRLTEYIYEAEEEGAVLLKKEDYQYHAVPDSHFLTTTRSRFSGASRLFVPLERIEEYYVLSGRKRVRQEFSWDESLLAYLPESREEETFFPNGERRSFIRSSWNPIAESYTIQSKTEFSTDHAGRIATEWHYGIECRPLWAYRFSYDEQGRLAARVKVIPRMHPDGSEYLLATDSIAYSWSADGSEQTALSYAYSDAWPPGWRPLSREVARKDSSGNDSYLLYEAPDPLSPGGWKNILKKIWAFNAGGYLFTEENYAWNERTESWQGGVYLRKQWNPGGYLLSEQTYYFDRYAEAMVNEFRWEYSWAYLQEPVLVYSSAPPPVTTLKPEHLTWEGLMTRRTHLRWDQYRWTALSSDDYFYGSASGPAVGPEEPPFSVRAYPNPASGMFTVELEGTGYTPATGTLSALDGRAVRRFTLTGQGQVDLGGLPDGVYVLRVNVPGYGDVVRKVIKQAYR